MLVSGLWAWRLERPVLSIIRGIRQCACLVRAVSVSGNALAVRVLSGEAGDRERHRISIFCFRSGLPISHGAFRLLLIRCPGCPGPLGVLTS